MANLHLLPLLTVVSAYALLSLASNPRDLYFSTLCAHPHRNFSYHIAKLRLSTISLLTELSDNKRYFCAFADDMAHNLKYTSIRSCLSNVDEKNALRFASDVVYEALMFLCHENYGKNFDVYFGRENSNCLKTLEEPANKEKTQKCFAPFYNWFDQYTTKEVACKSLDEIEKCSEKLKTELCSKDTPIVALQTSFYNAIKIVCKN